MGRETIEAVNTMEHLSILYQHGLNAFTLPPYHLHAILTFNTSTHCGMSFWDMESWEKFGRVGLEWELNWTQDYVSKGYGKKDAELLAGEMMDTFNKLDVLCDKKVKNSKVLEKWVVDMQKNWAH